MQLFKILQVTQSKMVAWTGTRYRLILICAIIAGSVGTWVGFALAQLFSHQGGIGLLFAEFLLLPYYFLYPLVKEANDIFFWISLGVLQLVYYFVLVWLVWRAVIRIKAGKSRL